MVEERLSDLVRDGREGHEFRYRLASGFANRDDYVLDAACGTGYGRQFFDCHGYVGVDKERPEGAQAWNFVRADLETWEPHFAYDVAVCFETLEHVADYFALMKALRRAGKWIIASVPVVPTVHRNEHHVHDFTPGQLAFELTADGRDRTWEHYQTVQQPSEMSEIVVLRRNR